MAPPDPKTKAPGGAVVTKRLSPTLVESVYSGRMTADLVGVVREQLSPFFHDETRLDWLINLEAVTGVELAPSRDSAGFYAWFRASGGDRISLVVTSAAVRMVVSALIFATGVQVRVFEARARALNHLEGRSGT